MFYILKDGMCIYSIPNGTKPTEWLKEYHKTMYKIYQDAFKDVVIKGKKNDN